LIRLVSPPEPKAWIHFRSKVEAMDQSADRRPGFGAFVVSAKVETSPKSIQEYAGGEHVARATVFTDVVGSTAKRGNHLIRRSGSFPPLMGGEGRDALFSVADQSSTGSLPSTIFTLLWVKYSFVSAFITIPRWS
jgi:hypothetical protein